MDDRPIFTSAHSHSRVGAGRLWLAFLLMPLVSAVAAAAVSPIVALGGAGSGGAGIFAFLAGVAAVVVVPAGAVPIFLTVKRRGRITLSQTLFAGAALGNAPGALLALMGAFFALLHVVGGTISQHLSPLTSLLVGALRIVVLGTAVGTISAAVFWFVGLRGTDLAE